MVHIAYRWTECRCTEDLSSKVPRHTGGVYRGDSDALIARIVQEAQAKRYIVDTVETTFPILKVMQEYKLLAPYGSEWFAPILPLRSSTVLIAGVAIR